MKMDVRYLRQLPKSLILSELEKLKSQCEDKVRQSPESILHSISIMCFILFISFFFILSYFCVSCETIYGTYQVQYAFSNYLI